MSRGSLKAVIDLGSNTFHLLVASVEHGKIVKEVCRLRRFVALAEEGGKHIGTKAFERGLAALREFVFILKEEGLSVGQVKAIGTAALRTADNGSEFLDRVKKETALQVELIDGDEEARLIAKGVRAAVPFGKSAKLIMDIGGGSVEFIIANAERNFWAESFPIGLLVLYHHLKPQDPFSQQNREALKVYLDEILPPLAKALKKYPVDTLVGASGSFDVIEAMKAPKNKEGHYLSLPASDFEQMFQMLLPLNLEERLQIQGLPQNRARLVVLAFALIDYVLQLSCAESIIVSDYAMKEGVLLSDAEKSAPH